MTILGIALLLAAGATPVAETAASAGPVRMSMSQIRAYNAQLTPSDPAYIKCVLNEPAGSLVKRKVCRTKGEWERLAIIGQRDAQDLYDYAKTHQYSISEEPEGSLIPMSSVGGN